MARLTDRDKRTLRTIGAFGMLSTRQIERLFFKNLAKTTLCRRLRILESEGVLRRIVGLPDSTLVWSLTKQCALDLGFEGTVGHVNRNSLEHDILLNDLRIALAKGGIGDSWLAEHELRREAWKKRPYRQKVPEAIPDALFTINVAGTFEVVAVELELRIKSRQRYQKLFRSYRFKDTIWFLWYLVPNIGMGKKLEREWNKGTSQWRTVKMMWSLIPEVLENPAQARVFSNGEEKLLTQVLTP